MSLSRVAEESTRAHVICKAVFVGALVVGLMSCSLAGPREAGLITESNDVEYPDGFGCVKAGMDRESLANDYSSVVAEVMEAGKFAHVAPLGVLLDLRAVRSRLQARGYRIVHPSQCAAWQVYPFKSVSEGE